MRACERYEEQISALIDGELDTAARGELLQHLRTCRTCRETYDLLKAVAAAVSDLEAEPPADLTDRIMTRIYAEPTPKAAEPPAPAEDTPDNITPIRPAKRRSPWKPLVAAAACMVLIVGAVTLTQPFHGTKSSAQVSLAEPESVSLDAAAEADMDVAEDIPVTDDGVAPAAEFTDAAEAIDGMVVARALSDGTTPENVIADADTLRAIAALLASGEETDSEEPAGVPICVLEETLDGETRRIRVWVADDDVIFTEDGAAFYRCSDAANALLELLELE